MMDFEKFDWGPFEENGMKDCLIMEFLSDEIIYLKSITVESGDIVVDIGASMGIFTYSVLNKSPKHCFVVEPSSVMMKTAMNNLMVNPVSFHRIALHHNSVFSDGWGDETECRGVSFGELIRELNIERIDFLKFDCEGGEYLMFTDENMDWILNNVSKLSGEFHLRNSEFREKFKQFCEVYLVKFPSFSVHSIDGVDIKWSLFDGDGKVNQSFLDYYGEVIISMDNRKS